MSKFISHILRYAERAILLLACLAIAGIATPTYAEIIQNTSPNQASTTVKNLEKVLRESGLCKHYPIIVEISKDNIAFVATYGDRRLSDKENKLLALHIARLVSRNVNKIAEVKIRLYDPASTRYWKDIVLSTTQIQDSLKSIPGQDQTLKSIKIVNNFGLVDGPNLQSRAESYEHILKLQHAGVKVDPFLSKLAQIETAEKNKQNVNAQLAELNASLDAAEPAIKPISSSIKTSDAEIQLQQSLKDACAKEAAALQAVHDAEQEQSDLTLPAADDRDSQDRYGVIYEAVQQKIDAALAELHEARRYRDSIYQQLIQAKERN